MNRLSLLALHIRERCPVKCTVSPDEFHPFISGTLVGANSESAFVLPHDAATKDLFLECNPDNVRLLLRPLSSITLEEKEELAESCHFNIDHLERPLHSWSVHGIPAAIKIVGWLMDHSFDCNELIELGIADDITKV